MVVLVVVVEVDPLFLSIEKKKEKMINWKKGEKWTKNKKSGGYNDGRTKKGGKKVNSSVFCVDRFYLLFPIKNSRNICTVKWWWWFLFLFSHRTVLLLITVFSFHVITMNEKT